MKKIVELKNPYFETNIRKWIFDGFTFLAESGKKFALYQIFTPMGGLTKFPTIESAWFLFIVNDHDRLSMLTHNGVIQDIGVYKLRGRSDGLNEKEIEAILQYAEKESLTIDSTRIMVEKKIEPIIVEKLSVIENAKANLINLTESETVKLMKFIENLQIEIEDFYPRTYHKLTILKTNLRKIYALLKHRDLYFELERLSNNPKYKLDANDSIMGFGPRIVLGGSFYKYFNLNKCDERWQIISPFENEHSKFI